MSAHDALMSFSNKQLKKARTQKRKNKAPEKEMVKAILTWAKEHKLNLDVIEASGGRNMYGAVTVKSGYSDISGCDKHGYAVYIEAKAQGKRATIRANQYQFLMNKIKSGAFCALVDRVESLASYYYCWLELREQGEFERSKKYLIDNLYVPKSIRKDDSDWI